MSGASPAILRALLTTALASTAAIQCTDAVRGSSLAPTRYTQPLAFLMMEIATAPLAIRYATAAFVSVDLSTPDFRTRSVHQRHHRASSSAIERESWPHCIRAMGAVVTPKLTKASWQAATKAKRVC
jgi:hypothetical protein